MHVKHVVKDNSILEQVMPAYQKFGKLISMIRDIYSLLLAMSMLKLGKSNSNIPSETSVSVL